MTFYIIHNQALYCVKWDEVQCVEKLEYTEDTQALFCNQYLLIQLSSSKVRRSLLAIDSSIWRSHTRGS